MAQALSTASASADLDETFCTCCRDLLGVDGVSISLASSFDLASMCTTNASISAFEELEFTLGEGPALDALASGEPSPPEHPPGEMSEKRPPFDAAAADSGLGGVFAFPLNVGAARLGVLTLFVNSITGLSAAQHDDALIAADALVHVILAAQGSTPASAEPVPFRDVGLFRAEIHQASGMLSAQIGCTVADALVQLRGRAYAVEKPIAELARDVVLGRTRLLRGADNQIEWSGEE
ncbi:MAG TPA: ANTAR domain-containing protein [Acidimicrobiales bacterium]